MTTERTAEELFLMLVNGDYSVAEEFIRKMGELNVLSV